jgi:hypothetical protein
MEKFSPSKSDTANNNPLSGNPGSFRDRHARVYHVGHQVYRGLDQTAGKNWQMLRNTQFFANRSSGGTIIETVEPGPDGIPEELRNRGWNTILRHAPVSFISYPYEWCFGMLKDASLLQLSLLEEAIHEGMILKDSSPFNIQWNGSRPIFIDIGSFEELQAGMPWAGYRQFCEMFLYPLMLQAFRNVPFHPWLRGAIDGIPSSDFRNLLSIRDYFRRGVVADVVLQAAMQSGYASKQKPVREELRKAGFTANLILSNIRRLKKNITRLNWSSGTTVWTDYADSNSYSGNDAERKETFVGNALSGKHHKLVWDLGCNTGHFSRIAASHADSVVAIDSDHATIEKLYRGLKAESNTTILPLVVDFSNPSPNLGWNCAERSDMAGRGRPDIILCLALIHHLTISCNIPVKETVAWLSSLCDELIIEFVSKDDPMVRRLLMNKDDQYTEYRQDIFESFLKEHFTVYKSVNLDNGTRILYHAGKR